MIFKKYLRFMNIYTEMECLFIILFISLNFYLYIKTTDVFDV